MPDQLRLFETSDAELLIGVYGKQQRTLDDLPYTAEFERIYAAMVGVQQPDEPLASLTRRELFHWLHNLRKAGRLPRLGKAATAPPRVDAAHEALLTQLVTAALGRISLRDQLPYTDAFDELCAAFNTRAGLQLSHHDLWRLIAKLAK